MILHLVSRSPFENSALEQCLKVASKEDAILLMGDAVLAIKHPKLLNTKKLHQIPTANMFALQEDLQARGLNLEENSPATAINFDGFVKLSEKYPSSHTWF